MKRLFYVTMTANAYVLADDKLDAEMTAEAEVRDGCNLKSCAFAVKPGDAIHREWKGSLVFGANEDITVEDALAAQESP